MAPKKLPAVDASVACRLLLGAQGLLDDPARTANKRTVAKLIRDLGYVQVDSINAVGERAHHLTLHSRLDGHRPALLKTLLERDRSFFEHWTHDASVIPVEWYPHWKVRFARFRREDRVKSWCVRRMGPDPKRIIRKVRARLRAEGPLMARDFEKEGAKDDRGGGWWNWDPSKAALEYLWRTGEVSIAQRRGFQRVYQLTEQVLPEQWSLATSTPTAHLEFACREAFARLIIATPVEITRYFATASLPLVRRWCKQQLARGSLVAVELRAANGQPPRPTLALPDYAARADALPDAPRRARLLSPFDPVLRDRARAARLFDFDYRFEAFVPQKKRRYGYYVMPILDGERLVGRIDSKYEREESALRVNAVWWEPGVRATKAQKRRLLEALERSAALCGAKRVDTPELS